MRRNGVKILCKIILVVSILLIACIFNYSVSTKFIFCSNISCLYEGDIDGVSITNRGELMLSNDINGRLEIPDPVVWSMVSDGNNIYIGTGHEGKVYKYIIANNSLDMIYDSEEMEVMALAIDSRNVIYIGTSPNGKIYKMDKKGEISVFSEIGEKNIYAMIFNKVGNLIVGTGENGRIYSVDKDGKAEILFDSPEINITSLNLMDDGAILAGTSSEGILYKIDGKGNFVLYDSDYDQISSIVLKGVDIYMGGVSISELSGEMQPAVIPTKISSIAVSSSDQQTATQQADFQKLQQQQVLFLKGKQLTRSSAIYKIDSNIRLDKLYSSDQNTVISMTNDSKLNIIFATSPDNSLWAINDNGDYAIIFKGEGVVSNIINSKGSIWFATSSPSYLYKLGSGYGKRGEYTSKVFDTNGISNWGKISWIAQLDSAASAKCYTRTGNTSEPDDNWSEWSKAYINFDGENIESPKARFIQYKCELQSSRPKSTPILRDVSISYLEQNQRPVISKVELLQPGTVYERMPSSEESRDQNSNIQQEGIKLSIVPQTMSAQISKFKPGWLTIKWEATDPNNDKLIFYLYYANINNIIWKVLKSGIEDNFYSFDSTMLPDGKYKFKIEASDSKSNPEDYFLTNYAITDRYYILDNTQPIIQIETIKYSSNEVLVSFKVVDELSCIQKVEYAVDIEKWNVVFPLDNVYDSKDEKFEIKIKNVSNGKGNLVIRAKDAIGNTTTKNVAYETK